MRLVVLFLLISISIFGQVIQFNWPNTAKVSDKYEVKLYQGSDEYNLVTHYSEPNLNVDPYHPNEGDGVTGYLEDRSLSFVQFDFEGEVLVEVKKLFGGAASRVEIQPKSFGIEPLYFDGYTVKFPIKQVMENDIPRYLSIKFVSSDNQDDDGAGGYNIKNCMMIFANRPETNKPNLNDSKVVVYSDTTDIQNADIIYFKAGDYDLTKRFTDKGEIGQLPYSHDGQKIYLEGGTIIRGAFHGKGFDNLWLYGRGIITGQDLAWHWFRDANDKKSAFCNFLGCENIHIEGIVIENPTHHSIPSSTNTYIKNLKIIGWASNQDGIRPSSGSTVEGIFIKTSDDQDYARGEHTVKNSIFWPMHNGAVGQLGWNNLGTGYAKFINCRFINSETKSVDKKNTGIIGSVADDGIKLVDQLWEDLVIEDQHAFLVNARLETKHGGLEGYLRNFQFKNITTEYPFMLNNGQLVKQKMEGVPNNWIENWTFTNLIVDGKLVTWNNYKEFFDLDLVGENGSNIDEKKWVRNILFNTEGPIYNIFVTTSGSGSVHPKGNKGVIQCLPNKSQSITITASSHNSIQQVILNGKPLGRVQTVNIKNVNQDYTLEVIFSDGKDYYNKLKSININDNDQEIEYLNGFNTLSHDSASLGTYSYSSNPKAVAKFPFYGRGVKYYTLKDSAGGISEIYLDGEKVSTIDFYSTVPIFNFLAYETNSLQLGNHEIEIKNSRYINDSSFSSNLYVDGFKYLEPSDSIVTVKTLSSIANSFNLEQNYPNPFNPTTVIKYSIPSYSKVNLSVYNILGEKVITLVDKFQNAGTYSKKFNAYKLASGIYFYRLTGKGRSNFSKTKKMMLLK